MHQDILIPILNYTPDAIKSTINTICFISQRKALQIKRCIANHHQNSFVNKKDRIEIKSVKICYAVY